MQYIIISSTVLNQFYVISDSISRKSYLLSAGGPNPRNSPRDACTHRTSNTHERSSSTSAIRRGNK